MRIPLNFLVFISFLASVNLLRGSDHAQIRSWKRGVSANVLSSDQVALLAPGVSWVYNWGSTPNNVEVADEMEFIPMIWGYNQGQLDGVKAYLDGGATPSAVFFLNEPNYVYPLGSFVEPQTAAAWLNTVRETLAGYEFSLIGPHMALGTATADSITAYDPIQEKEVTYTTGALYLDAYDYYVGDTPTDALSFHSYGNGEMEFWVDTMYARTGKPVWVTEFAWMGTTDEDEQYDYMLKTLDYLEHSPKVERYAWFKADSTGQNTSLKLLATRVAVAALTPLGELYVNYPAFDPDYYFPIPCRIQVESYSAKENMYMTRADSADGVGAVKITSSRIEAWIEFQVEAVEAGDHRIRMRISSDSFADLGDTAAGSEMTDPPTGIERDLFFTTPLSGGKQTVRILIKGFTGKVDWLEFEKIAEG